MSYEIGDELLDDASSSCCGASVIDESGEGKEGVCNDCYEHCGVVTAESYMQECKDEGEHMKHTFIDDGKTLCYNCEGEA